MKKIFFLLLLLLSNVFIYAEEKAEIYFTHNFRHTSDDFYGNLNGVNNLERHNYNLNLWGIGFKYSPVQTLFLDLSNKNYCSLL